MKAFVYIRHWSQIYKPFINFLFEKKKLNATHFPRIATSAIKMTSDQI